MMGEKGSNNEERDEIKLTGLHACMLIEGEGLDNRAVSRQDLGFDQRKERGPAMQREAAARRRGGEGCGEQRWD